MQADGRGPSVALHTMFGGALARMHRMRRFKGRARRGAGGRTAAERAAAERAAHAKAELLAGSLSARRCYSSASAGPLLDYITFDPRLLLFEFAHDLLLREAQVTLVERFVAAQREGRSLCHQLIMGAGKTTVVARRCVPPLIAILKPRAEGAASRCAAARWRQGGRS